MRRIILAFTVLAALAGFQQPRYHRVTILGDSFAGGLYASDEAHTWRALLTNDADSVAVLGTTGRLMVTPDTLSIVSDDLQTRNPDLFIVELGINDAAQNTDPAQFETATRQLFDLLRGRTVLVSGIPWLGTAYPERIVVLDSILRRVSAEYGYRFADAYDATYGHYEYLSSPDIPSAFPPDYRGDGFHYGDVGHYALYVLYRDALPFYIWFPALSLDDPNIHW